MRNLINSIREKIGDMSQGELLFLVSVGAFLALLPAWMNYDIISRDGASQYVPAARMFYEGRFHEGFLLPQLPLFPLIIAAIAKLTGFSLELSGRVASYIAYVLAAIGMFKMGQVLFKNRVIAFLAVLFLVTNRQFVDRSIDCLKESLLICCIVWGNYLILKGISTLGRKESYYIAGAFILLVGTLFRSTSLVFLFAWLAIWVFHKREGVGARAALFILPVACVLIIWAVNPDLPVFRKSLQFKYFFVSPHGIAAILKSSLDSVASFFSTGNPLIILFGFIGLYYWHKDFYFFHVCLVLGMFLLILAMWVFSSNRYFLAPIMWLYPLAAYAVARTYKSGTRPLKVMAVLCVVSSVVLWAHIAFTPPDKDRMSRKEAGEWILTRIGPDQEIISNRERLVFYAKGRYVPLSAYNKMGDLKDKVLAVDTMHEDGRVIMEEAHSRGIDPDRRFRSILVYLPKS